MAPDPIPFVDLPAQYADVKDVLLERIGALIDKGAFVGGEPVARFEADLAEYCDVAHVVGCASGTDALTLSLLALGLKRNERVIVPVNTYIATANAVVHAGGVPVFVDCDPNTYLLDPSEVEHRLQHDGYRYRFIILVHLYGQPCHMTDLLELASEYGLTVLEDNAQALGASYGGQMTGSFGDAGAVSFYPAKNLGSFGQGGAVLTSDPEVAAKVRMYANQGEMSKHHHEVIGYNSRLHSIQAEVLRTLLPLLDSHNDARYAVAARYAERLGSARLQETVPGSHPSYHLLEYRCDDRFARAALSEALQLNGIGFGYHYLWPIHKQAAYSKRCKKECYPVAEKVTQCLISLPMHPHLCMSDVDRVCEVVERSRRG